MGELGTVQRVEGNRVIVEWDKYVMDIGVDPAWIEKVPVCRNGK